MKKIFILCCLFLIGSIGYCADWQEVAYKIYADISSGKKYSNGNIEVWTKMLNYNVNEDKIGDKKWHHSLGLDEYDCINNKHLTKFYAFYDLDGSVIERGNGLGQWEYIVPGSRMEAVHQFLCNNYGKR